MVEGARLESAYTSKGYRGFESPSLRGKARSADADFEPNPVSSRTYGIFRFCSVFAESGLGAKIRHTWRSKSYPAHRIVYAGESQLFTEPAMIPGNSDPTAGDFDLLMANLWAWVIRTVFCEP